MKKNDLIILAALFGLWIAWPNIYQKINPPKPEPTAVEAPSPGQGAGVSVPSPSLSAPTTDVPAPSEAAVPAASPVVQPALPDDPALTPLAEEAVDGDEQTFVFEDEQVRLTLSSRGGTLVDAVVKEYRAENKEESGPVHLDFHPYRAAAYQNLAGFGQHDLFQMRPGPGNQSVTFTRSVNGLTLEREYRMADSYQLVVQDRFTNQSGQSLQMPEMAMQTGAMRDQPGESSIPGMPSLGVDTLAANSEKVRHAAKLLNKSLKDRSGWNEEVLESEGAPDWVAAKNKYFVQILTPEDGGQYSSAFGAWDKETGRLGAIGAKIHFDDFVLQNQASHTRLTRIYTGPKKLSLLQSLHNHKDGIMQLGYWFLPWIGARLLWLINGVESVIGNYGIAIMIVTLLIRMLFWPLTHKGTESMRKMSELSPQMKAINEKYKDNAQKRQEELMKFYKENKINPVGGCLPMLVQIPIFLSLFYVLKSAIELRFASFLWIKDLSEPDRLFAFGRSFPVLGDHFNLLPFLMAVSMYFQQKVAPMTPTNASGDDAQQQIQQTMMKMMPFMMFFMLYNFAAGLALYWTTQNVLMIVQHLVYKKRKAWQAAHA